MDRSFFARPAPVVAKALIGMRLLHREAGGIVVEAEAYDQMDPASHSFRGRTARNAAMFGPPGHAYVYFSYGAHWCLNVVTGKEGSGQAVLIRALEPTAGIDRMAARRGVRGEITARILRDLARGPGRLTQALGVDRSHDAIDLQSGPLGLYRPVAPVFRRYRQITASPRIGIRKGAETPWRFCSMDSRFLSRPPG